VLTASVHVDPGAGWFPHFLGFEAENDRANLNLPLAPGTWDDGWLAAVRRAAEFAVPARALVVPLGADAAAVAPASPPELQAPGDRVKLAPGVYARDDYVAGDARSRADDLHALFADPEVDVVQALQGGFGSSEILSHLDFDLIGQNPKPFVGYSDITSLHVPIRQRAGFATFYGYGLLCMGAKD